MDSMHDFTELVCCICIDCHACQKIGFGSEAVQGSRGGALDRQHGLKSSDDPRFLWIAERVEGFTSSAWHNEERLPSLSRGRLAHRAGLKEIGLFRGLVVSARCHYGLVRSFVLPRDLSGYWILVCS